MPDDSYFMDDENESIRLDRKTDPEIVKKQALWAGLQPGMRVADMGCGPGKTTFYLNHLVKPSGSVLGIDISPQRIDYAKSKYMDEGVKYLLGDIRKPLEHLGQFDFIWVRLVFEFYRSTSFDIVKNISSALKPGGILCLIDLDHNCLSHYGISDRLNNAIFGIMRALEAKTDFDAYAGRKLYSYLYDLGYKEILVDVSMQHLIYGQFGEIDMFNWGKKLEIAAKNSGYSFDEFADGFDEFRKECKSFFEDPRSFTYTPIICCRGIKV